MLVLVGRDTPKLRAVLDANRADGLRAATYDGIFSNGGEVSDPTMRMAMAFADPDNGAHDEAHADELHFARLLDEGYRNALALYRLRVKWLPHLTHIEACANPYGCPDERPAAKGRKGLCGGCYAWQRNHTDDPWRRQPRVKSVAA
jgi:hypothetical protein